MRWCLFAVIVLLAACQSTSIERAAPVPVAVVTEYQLPDWQSPRERDHAQVGQIIDLRSGHEITRDALVQTLAAAPVVLLGEKHDNFDHHALQLWLLKTLEAQRKQGALVMEMLTVNQQENVSAVQNKIRAGEMPDDVPAALEWHTGWDWQQYGELVTYALQQPYPLLAANLNRDALMGIYRDPPVLKGSASTAAEVSLRLSEQIRESHCNKLPEKQVPAMLAVQQQRDRSMAQILLDAPRPALLIAGAYHVRYDLGIPLHLQDLQSLDVPDKDAQKVLIFAEVGQTIDQGSADFVWYTPAVAEKDYCADL